MPKLRDPRLINWARPVNMNHPLNRSLAGWWMVTPNSRGGNIFRDLTNRNHGDIFNLTAADWKGRDRSGSWGSLSFLDASDDYVSIPNYIRIDNNDFSVCCWIKTSDTTRQAIIANYETTEGQWFALEMNLSVSGRPQFIVDDNTADITVNSSITNLNDNTWRFIAGVRDGTNIKIYVDGALTGTENIGAGYGDIYGNLGPQIGRYGTITTLDYTGQIDDVRIMYRALSAEEMQYLYLLAPKGYPGVI